MGEMSDWAGQAPAGGRGDSHIGHFTCFLPLTSPLQKKTEAQRGVAKPVTGRVGMEPNLAGMTALATTLPAAPLPMPVWPSRGGVRFSAEPVPLAAQRWGKRKTSHGVLEA